MPISQLTLDAGNGLDRVGLDFAVFSRTPPPSSDVPAPAALPLLGSALAALAFARRRRRAGA
ncbi:MAG: PEP-CTERM sorting domain-containing protein [Pseudomonadota bacterium]